MDVIREGTMFPPLPNSDEGSIEECLDDLRDCLGTLKRYSPAVIAIALRLQLERQLRTLLVEQQCSPDALREFIRDLESEVLVDSDG